MLNFGGMKTRVELLRAVEPLYYLLYPSGINHQKYTHHRFILRSPNTITGM